MTTIDFTREQNEDRELIHVLWTSITALLGRPHEGSPGDDAAVVDALVSADAPAWVGREFGEGGFDDSGVDEDGWWISRRVEPTRATETRYEIIPESDLPEGLRFDVPRRDQGQIVEVAYADHPTCRSEAGWCSDPRVASPYRRITDRSDRSVVYELIVR